MGTNKMKKNLSLIILCLILCYASVKSCEEWKTESSIEMNSIAGCNDKCFKCYPEQGKAHAAHCKTISPCDNIYGNLYWEIVTEEKRSSFLTEEILKSEHTIEASAKIDQEMKKMKKAEQQQLKRGKNTKGLNKSKNNSKIVGVYFGNWKIYGRGFKMCNIPGDKIDRLYYSFFNPTSGKCELSDPWADIDRPGPVDGKCGNEEQPSSDPLKGNFYQLKMLKKRYTNMKVIASLGGWSYSKEFHEHIMKSKESRKTLVDSCGAFLKKYSDVLDGFDIALLYPCTPEDEACGPGITPTESDKEIYVEFMKEMRKAIGKEAILTSAISAAGSKMDALDFKKLNKYVDSYNIMTYDFTSGSWGAKYSGHHTCPFSNPADPLHENRGDFSANFAANSAVEKGAKPEKVNIGVAFYGRGFQIENIDKQGPFIASKGGIKVGNLEKNSFDYYEIKANYLNSETDFFDSVAHAPYVINGNKYISYDDKRSILAKKFIIARSGYQGIFAWELSGDTDDFELLNEMHKLKHERLDQLKLRFKKQTA